MHLVSWNVNGIRSVLSKGFLEWFKETGPDVLALQETKAHPGQVDLRDWPEDYQQFWNPAGKKGYSGTLVLTRREPLNVEMGLGDSELDGEGRVITVEFPDFFLVNVYTPNSQRELTRLEYRTQVWDRAFEEHLHGLDQKKPVIFCGDLNVAHQEIDLANPKTNTRNAGFTQEERESFTRILDRGFLDTFRHFEPGGGHYSWWSYRSGARARNIGWRIDYFCASHRLKDRLKAAAIHPQVTGSDHCPVSLQLD